MPLPPDDRPGRPRRRSRRPRRPRSGRRRTPTAHRRHPAHRRGRERPALSETDKKWGDTSDHARQTGPPPRGPGGTPRPPAAGGAAHEEAANITSGREAAGGERRPPTAGAAARPQKGRERARPVGPQREGPRTARGASARGDPVARLPEVWARGSLPRHPDGHRGPPAPDRQCTYIHTYAWCNGVR